MPNGPMLDQNHYTIEVTWQYNQVLKLFTSHLKPCLHFSNTLNIAKEVWFQVT